jgi:Ca2+-transporting ATPase
MNISNWYTQKIPYILHEFNTDLERGLSADAADARLREYGDNEIQPSHERPIISFFAKQFSSITVVLLLIIGVIHLYPHRALPEAIAIFAILCLHLLWRFIQDSKTQAQCRTIKRGLEATVSVIRDATVVEVSPTAVVPGDLLVLSEGSYIPADARIVDAEDLVVDETPLFGTSISSQKTTDDMPDRTVPPEKQTNMVFACTYVLEGEGRAIVVGTSEELEINQPHRNVPASLDLDSEAEIQMGGVYNHFKIVGLILGGIAVLTTWYIQRKSFEENWQSLLFLGLGFVIASIPEGIVSTCRAILAENTYRLFKKGIGIRDVVNLERLSSVTAVCVNEIGNFTQERMTASRVFVDEELVERETWEDRLKLDETVTQETDETLGASQPPNASVSPGFQLLILLATLCATHSRSRGAINQIPSDSDNIAEALSQLADRIGFDLEHYDSALSKVAEISETSDPPYKAIVLETEENKFLNIMFGHPDAIIQGSHRIQIGGTMNRISYDQKQMIRLAAQYLSDNRAQVFGVAYRSRNSVPPQEDIGRNLTFLGLIAFTPQEYEGSKESIQFCLGAGVKVVMITDKDRHSSSDLAREFGIIEDGNAVVTQSDLDGFSDEHYDSIVNRLLVYCRPSPDQKLKLVEQLKHNNHSVGFCGQIPTDSRAMQAADVSIASASRSSPVVQQNAGCVILKDGFRVITNLLLHAREAQSNLKNSMRWLLTCTLAQMTTLLIGLVLHLGSGLQLWREFPMPLTLHHIIWIHLIVNLIPLIALGQNRIQGELKHNRSQQVQPFLSKDYRFDILVRSLLIALMTIIGFVVTVKSPDPTRAQTVACSTLIFTQLVSNFQCHRQNPWQSLFRRILANVPLLITILACMGLHLFIVYLPIAHPILRIEPLSTEWQWVVFPSLLMLLPFSLVKHRHSLGKSDSVG